MNWFGDSERLKSCKKKCNDDEDLISKNEPGITDSIKGWFSGAPSMPSMPSFSSAPPPPVQAGGGKRHRQRRYKHKGGTASSTETPTPTATPTIKPFYNSAVASGASYISGVPTAPVKMAGGRRKSKGKGKRRTMRGGYRYYDINTNNKITPLVKYAYSVKNLTGGKRRSTKKRRHSK